MTAQEVIKLGQQLTEPVHQNYFNSNFFLATLVTGLLVLILLVSLDIGLLTSLQGSLVIMLVSSFITIFCFVSTDTYREDYRKHVDAVFKWQKEVADPYIESLPYLERELDTVILNTAEMKTGEYIDELPLIISYTKNGKTVTTSGVYPIEKSLKEGEKPLLKYKRLNKELGHYALKGDYFEKVILPKDFKVDPASN
jgi:hypothetical protein